MGENIHILVQKIAVEDDQQAFKQLFWHYYEYLFYFSNAMVKCREVAEEIVEDVFVGVWNKRRKLPEVNNLKVYFYVAVKNLSINYLNRSGSRYLLDLNALDVPLIASDLNPEDHLVASEMRQALDKATAELPPKCRLVYKLVKEDGLRYKEVASILDISPRTVENHMATALRKIALRIHVDFKTPVVKSKEGIEE